MNPKPAFYLSLVLLIASLAVAQVPCGPAPSPSPTPIVSWPQFQFGSAHTGCNPYEHVLNTGNVGTLNVKWTHAASKEGSVAGVVVSGGVAYFTENDISADLAIVEAVKTSDGSFLWEYYIGPPANQFTQPVVGNGLVYVGYTGDNNVYALNAATGAFVWKYAVAGMSLPAVANGMVYIGSGDNNVYALNGTTGTLIWKYTTGGGVSTPAVANGMVYVTSGDNHVYALNASTGAFLWSYATGGSSPVVANGLVYISSNQVYALNASTGAVVWTYPISTGGLPTVGNGVVLLPFSESMNGAIDALNANTGAFLWTHTFGLEEGPYSLALANGVLYVGVNSFTGSLQAFNAATGALLFTTGWTQVAEGPVVAEGMVYIPTAYEGMEPGALYAFSLP